MRAERPAFQLPCDSYERSVLLRKFSCLVYLEPSLESSKRAALRVKGLQTAFLNEKTGAEPTQCHMWPHSVNIVGIVRTTATL